MSSIIPCSWTRLFFIASFVVFKTLLINEAEIDGIRHLGRCMGVCNNCNVGHAVQGWEPHEHNSTVAVTAGNKAFVWWRVTGVYQDDW